MSREIYTGQYNEAHKERVVYFKVTINSVQPDNRINKLTEDDLERWFKNHIDALAAGMRLNYGNNMHQINVERLKPDQEDEE